MSEPTPHRSMMPRSTALLGLVLFGCIALPLTPGGRSFVQILHAAFAEGIGRGVVMLVGFGSPFLFGLTVALGGRSKSDAAAASLVRLPVTMMCSQLLLSAWTIWRGGGAIAALPMLLFATTLSVYVVHHSASERASGRHASFRWYVQAGSLLIVGLAGWLWLQRMAGLSMGIAVDVAGLSALSLLLRSRSGSTPEPSGS